jgi:hypothetical protein
LTRRLCAVISRAVTPACDLITFFTNGAGSATSTTDGDELAQRWSRRPTFVLAPAHRPIIVSQCTKETPSDTDLRVPWRVPAHSVDTVPLGAAIALTGTLGFTNTASAGKREVQDEHPEDVCRQTLGDGWRKHLSPHLVENEKSWSNLRVAIDDFQGKIRIRHSRERLRLVYAATLPYSACQNGKQSTPPTSTAHGRQASKRRSKNP